MRLNYIKIMNMNMNMNNYNTNYYNRYNTYSTFKNVQYYNLTYYRPNGSCLNQIELDCFKHDDYITLLKLYLVFGISKKIVLYFDKFDIKSISNGFGQLLITSVIDLELGKKLLEINFPIYLSNIDTWFKYPELKKEIIKNKMGKDELVMLITNRMITINNQRYDSGNCTILDFENLINLFKIDEETSSVIFEYYYTRLTFETFNKIKDVLVPFKKINLITSNSSSDKYIDYLLSKNIDFTLKLNYDLVNSIDTKILKKILDGDHVKDLDLIIKRQIVNSNNSLNNFKLLCDYYESNELICLCFTNYDCMKYYYKNLKKTIGQDDFFKQLTKMMSYNIYDYDSDVLCYEKKWWADPVRTLDFFDKRFNENETNYNYLINGFLMKLIDKNMFDNYSVDDKSIILQYVAKYSLSNFRKLVFGLSTSTKYDPNVKSTWDINDAHLISLMMNSASKSSICSTMKACLKKFDSFTAINELVVSCVIYGQPQCLKELLKIYGDCFNEKILKDYYDGITDIMFHMQPTYPILDIRMNQTKVYRRHSSNYRKVRCLFSF